MTSTIKRKEDYYVPGDMISLQNVPETWAGILTASSKVLYFTIPVGKSLEKISSISFSSLGGSIRGVSGYMDTSNCVFFDADTSKITASYDSYNVRKSNDYAITLQFAYNTAFNVTNNSPAMFTANYATIVFS